MSFYVALPSHANRHEFPQNQANSFKIRLPTLLHLPGGQWQVGLSAVSLPDTRVNMYDLLQKGNHVLNIHWIQDIPPSIKKDSIGTTEVYIDDLKDLDWIVDGVSFMKAAINHVEQQRRATAVLGGKFVNASGQHTYVKFSCEGEDLVIDNTNVCHCGPSSTPSFSVHTKLAPKDGLDRAFGHSLVRVHIGAQLATRIPARSSPHHGAREWMEPSRRHLRQPCVLGRESTTLSEPEHELQLAFH